MARNRHRMPGLVVGLIAGLVQGLGPGWVSPYPALAAEPAIEGSGTATFSPESDDLDFTTVTLDGGKTDENESARLINTTGEESEDQTPNAAGDAADGAEESQSAPLTNTTGGESETETSNAAEGGADGTESNPAPMTDTEVSEEPAEDLTTAANTPPIFNLGDDVTVEEGSGAYTAANFLSGLSPVEEGQRIISLTVSSDPSALFTEDGQPAIDEDGTLTFTPAPMPTAPPR